MYPAQSQSISVVASVARVVTAVDRCSVDEVQRQRNARGRVVVDSSRRLSYGVRIVRRMGVRGKKCRGECRAPVTRESVCESGGLAVGGREY